MKIAVVGINYYPEMTGISVYTTQMCEYLAAKGHDVRVVTAFPYYPFGYDFSNWYKKNSLNRFSGFFSEKRNGVRIFRSNLYKPAKPSTIKRIAHELSFIISTWIRLIFDFERCDIVICISPPLPLGLAVRLFANIKKAQLILHVQDMQPDAAIGLGMIRGRTLIALLKLMEKTVYNAADRITTICETMRQKIIRKGVDSNKVGMLCNWADADNITPASRTNSFSARHHLDGKFVVLHAGNIGEKQDMRVIMEAAEAMKKDGSVMFLLVGRGARRRYVEEYVKDHCLNNVLLLDVQPEEFLKEMFVSCDVALITQRKGAEDCVMPSKIFGPACAGRPVIISGDENSEIERLAREHDFGITIPAKDTAGLIAGICRLRDDRVLAERMGRNGRSFMVNHNHINIVLGRFEEGLRSMCGKIRIPADISCLSRKESGCTER